MQDLKIIRASTFCFWRIENDVPAETLSPWKGVVMHSHFKFLVAPAALILVHCNQIEPTAASASKNAASNKAPLVFDESVLLRPPAYNKDMGALAKTATTPYYVFSAPGQIDWSDCDAQVLDGEWNYPCGSSPYLVHHTEATYSSRVAANPAAMWTAVPGMHAIQNRVLFDNEQAESHLFPPPMLKAGGGLHNIIVDLDFEVSSEEGWDYLYITSTASDGSCNSPGVVREKVSGVQSGHVSFVIPAYCENPWVGVYYIKDGSLSAHGDYARVENVEIHSATSL
jgi:hypothetical protein